MEYKVINMQYLDSVSGGDPNIINEIAVMYKNQVAEIYNDMVSSHSLKKFELLGNLAHKAKSSAAILGMDDLAEMLKKFELQAKESVNTEQYESYITQFKSESDAAIEELDDLINYRLNNG